MFTSIKTGAYLLNLSTIYTAPWKCLITTLFSNIAGVDYGAPNPSTFTFTATQTIQCTNIPITDDTLVEGHFHETFNITLTQTLPTDPGVQLAPSTATVSIDDNDGK